MDLFKSKYLKRSVKLSSISDFNASTSDCDDSEDENLQTFGFVIDKKPDEHKSESVKGNRKETIELSTCLKSSIDTESCINLVKSLNEESLALANDLKNKTAITSGFEQQYKVKPFRVSRRMQKKQNRLAREATTGPKWFNIPAAELTEEQKRDLMVLKMRKSLDPKRFYKKNDGKEPSKYLQVGTVIETPADFYHSRVPKKQRKRTFVEELLADAEFKKKAKQKYSEIRMKNPNYKKLKMKKLRKTEEKKKVKAKKHAKRLKKQK